jgi:hypothetical protein
MYVLAGIAASLVAAPAAPAAVSVLFLDRCTDTCTLTPGVEDSRLDHSSLVGAEAVLPAFPHGDATWEAVVDCVRESFAPFAIAVTDADPLDAEHLEVKVAGQPQQIGLPMGVGVVAPVTCDGDRVVENGIGFAFAASYGDVPLEICWGAAQAAGSLLGLDHVLLEGDVMTYLDGSLPKRFLDETAACGEFAPRSCSCGGSTQNSHQQLLATLPEPGTLAGTTAALGALAAVAARRGVGTHTGERC